MTLDAGDIARLAEAEHAVLRAAHALSGAILSLEAQLAARPAKTEKLINDAYEYVGQCQLKLQRAVRDLAHPSLRFR